MVSLCFFRSIYGFFRVHLVFHVGFLSRNSLGFLWVSPRVFKDSFRIQTGENKTNELWFHVGILWDSLGFRVSLRFTSLKGFISGFFRASVGFHVGFDLGFCVGFLIRKFCQGFQTFMWVSLRIL